MANLDGGGGQFPLTFILLVGSIKTNGVLVLNDMLL